MAVCRPGIFSSVVIVTWELIQNWFLINQFMFSLLVKCKHPILTPRILHVFLQGRPLVGSMTAQIRISMPFGVRLLLLSFSGLNRKGLLFLLCSCLVFSFYLLCYSVFDKKDGKRSKSEIDQKFYSWNKEREMSETVLRTPVFCISKWKPKSFPQIF